MKILHETKDNIVVAKIIGNLSHIESLEFKNYFLPIVEQEGLKGLVVNMREVPTVDSAGLAMMINMFVNANKLRTPVALFNLCHKVKTACEIVRLALIVPHFHTHDEAIAFIESKIKVVPD